MTYSIFCMCLFNASPMFYQARIEWLQLGPLRQLIGRLCVYEIHDKSLFFFLAQAVKTITENDCTRPLWLLLL